nr:hypothetical protein B0A51_07156 [Rachicladosporium sp. CCFEE 5018]
MLYELIGVKSKSPSSLSSSSSSHTPLISSRIVRTSSLLVLNAGGVVRGITNWGTFRLPKPYRKQGATYDSGHYFILRFDSSAKTQHAVRRTLGLDPRLIRYSVVKMGAKLEDVAKVGGQAEWGGKGEGY